LELEWAFCISWQSSDLAAVTEVDDVGVERMRASDSELEAMWDDVFRAMREARSTVPQLRRDRNVVLQPSYFRSLIFASFADGHVNGGFSQRLKCAALKSRQRRENHLR
jgi:hypothetical protein